MPEKLWGRPRRRYWFKPSGRRFHLSVRLAEDGLRGFRHRYLCSQDRGGTCFEFDDDWIRPRCPEPGHLAAGALGDWHADQPQRARQPIPVDPIHRAACRGRHRPRGRRHRLRYRWRSSAPVGDSYDNALAESIIGLFKIEDIKFLCPWKSVGQVEWETLKWGDWSNNTRLHNAIGYITPHEAEEAFYARLNAAEKAV